MTVQSVVRIVKNQQVAPGYYRLILAAGDAAAVAKPGQFVHLRCSDSFDPLLRRPISINAADRARGQITLLFHAAGRGTSLLAERKKGENVDMLGPLGRGYTMPRKNVRAALVAGGMGIAPIFFLLQELAVMNVHVAVFLGAANKEQLLLTREIKRLGHLLFVATDDGTAGFKGTVTGLLELCLGDNELISPGKSSGPILTLKRRFKRNFPASLDLIYGCGPRGMLQKLSEITRSRGIPCEISLEERMGCGVGACLSCVCKTGSREAGFNYRRICVEGPVFPSDEVLWT